jgi:hypothetical protein
MNEHSQTGSKSQTAVASVLKTLASGLFIGAAFSFLFGGGLIHALAGTQRATAEIYSTSLAVFLALLGTAANQLGRK